MAEGAGVGRGAMGLQTLMLLAACLLRGVDLYRWGVDRHICRVKSVDA
jgi:hypothetical protein